MVKSIYVKEEVCIGCRLCEIHCIVQHSRTRNIIKAFKEFPRPLSRVRVEERKNTSFALQCRHCDEAPCIETCITGAMHRENGRVLCDTERCVGCWMCIMVCPFGVIGREGDSKKVASKCDLCLGVDVPVCVSNCPNEALIYEEERR